MRIKYACVVCGVCFIVKIIIMPMLTLQSDTRTAGYLKHNQCFAKSDLLKDAKTCTNAFNSQVQNVSSSDQIASYTDNPVCR